VSAFALANGDKSATEVCPPSNKDCVKFFNALDLPQSRHTVCFHSCDINEHAKDLTMLPRALVLATALVSVSVASASAEVVTADVLDWNASTRTVTLEDFSQFSEIPASVKIPSELKAGISITVDYEATDNGMASYNSITVNNEISKRVIPNDKRS
jgi:hypothetical protein